MASSLTVLALTDHDLAPVLPATTVDRERGGLRFIHGTELTGTHGDREYHLLVYFPGEMPGAFGAFCRTRAQARAHRFDLVCERLGLSARADADAHAGNRALTRHHLATALLKERPELTWMDAYTLLKNPQTVPLCDLAFVDAIRLGREAGGFTSWAHPPLNDAQTHTEGFVRAGLQALEALRPTTDRPTKNGLSRLAKRHGLLLTGGTDWHGYTDNFGHYAVSGEHADRFLAALDA